MSMRSWEDFSEFEKKGENIRMKIKPYLVPFDYGNMELLPDAPPEIVKLRDEFLEWREEYQTQERDLPLSDYY